MKNIKVVDNGDGTANIMSIPASDLIILYGMIPSEEDTPVTVLMELKHAISDVGIGQIGDMLDQEEANRKEST